jgi:galactoside O-acetyltransferase
VGAVSDASPLSLAYSEYIAVWRLIVLRAMIRIADWLLGWPTRNLDSVSIAPSSIVSWRRLKRVSGNKLSIGEASIVHAGITFEAAGGEVRIGDRVFLGRSNLMCYKAIHIGNDVIMSWGVTVVDHDSHSTDWDKRQNDVSDWALGKKDWSQIATARVIVEDKCWIGFNVSILKGVTIGEGAVVGACSVVTRDVTPYTVVAGNPARLIRTLDRPDLPLNLNPSSQRKDNAALPE